jgi:hypothetical protein
MEKQSLKWMPLKINFFKSMEGGKHPVLKRFIKMQERNKLPAISGLFEL